MLNPRLEVYATGLDHPECVILDGGSGLVAGGEAGQIYRVDARGAVSTIAELPGCCLGLALAPDGSVVVCTVDPPAIHKVDMRSGRWATISDGTIGLTCPNYAVFTPRGVLIVSDSGSWGTPDGRILTRSPDGSWRVIAAGLNFPNGLAIAKDGRRLFVVESTADRIMVANLETSKLALVPWANRVEHVPDGIALHLDGTMYIGCWARDRVYASDPEGRVSLLVEDGDATILNRPTNIAIGTDGSCLYVANVGGRHITRVWLDDARGQPPGAAPAAIEEIPPTLADRDVVTPGHRIDSAVIDGWWRAPCARET
jgi:gluconolactonase